MNTARPEERSEENGVTHVQPLFLSKNRLKLGCFSFNLQGGSTPSLAKEVIGKLDWSVQVRIAQAAEAAGLDAIIPVGRWKAVGGASNFWGESYETVAWAAGLVAATKTMTIMSTVHVPLLHPVRAAKSAVTIDHMSNGRFGLNIVAGWNEAECAMFGKRQLSHDARYDEAEEWTNFVKRLWSETKPFDFEGKYYQAPGAISEPRPLASRPVLMSAGASPAGREFASKNCDVIFISGPPNLEAARADVADVKRRAAAYGRDVQVWTLGAVVCRPTEAEVKSFYNYYVHEKGDWEAAMLVMGHTKKGGLQSTDNVPRDLLYEGMIAGSHGYRLMGTPEQVVSSLSDLADAGLDGVALVFPDYVDGLETFRRDIRPLAQQAGLMAVSPAPSSVFS